MHRIETNRDNTEQIMHNQEEVVVARIFGLIIEMTLLLPQLQHKPPLVTWKHLKF